MVVYAKGGFQQQELLHGQLLAKYCDSFPRGRTQGFSLLYSFRIAPGQTKDLPGEVQVDFVAMLEGLSGWESERQLLAGNTAGKCGVWRVFGGCLAGACRVFGRGLPGAWRVFCRSLTRVWRELGGCLAGVLRVFCWCLAGSLRELDGCWA